MPTADQQLTRVMDLECRALEGGSQFEISFSSETPCTRWGVREILLHDAGAVDLSRMENGSAALLFSHGNDPNYGRVPIGKIVRAWVDQAQRKCRAVLEFDEEDDSCRRLKSKMEKGMLTGVSVGCNVLSWMELKSGATSQDGRFTGPVNIAVRWQPYEISLEPLPADATVGLGRNLNDGQEEQRKMAENTMANTATGMGDGQAAPAVAAVADDRQRAIDGQVLPPVVSAGTVDVAAEVARAVAADRARVSEVTALCRSFDVDERDYISRELSVDSVRELLLKKLAAERAPVRAGIGGDVTVVQDEMDRVRAAAIDGILLRSNVAVENPAAGASEFRGMSIRNIAAECLFRSGEANVLRLGAEDLLKRSLTPDSAYISIMAGVANKVVLAAHPTAPTTFQLWTSRGTASDFKPTEFYEISASGSLDELPQTGEFKEGRLSDKPVATRRLLTFGKKISFTRQMFVNDDVQMITKTLTAYTLAFARGINTAVYDLLKNNPSMYDGNPLFSAAHKNLAAPTAPSTEAFSDARLLMRGQTDIGGKVTLNIAPEFILCGARDETEIERLLTSLADPSSNNSGVANVFRNRMTPIIDAALDTDSGAQPYYFAADPRIADTIEVSYLNGIDSPTVETNQEFDVLGTSFRVFGDRGVTLLGYKGLVKNPGAARK